MLLQAWEAIVRTIRRKPQVQAWLARLGATTKGTRKQLNASLSFELLAASGEKATADLVREVAQAALERDVRVREFVEQVMPVPQN